MAGWLAFEVGGGRPRDVVTLDAGASPSDHWFAQPVSVHPLCDPLWGPATKAFTPSKGAAHHRRVRTINARRPTSLTM